MFICSQRLLLRPFWPEDWKALHMAICDREIVQNLARAPWPYSSDDAREFASRPQDRLLPHFAVTLPGNGGELIGSAGLGADGDNVEVGYWIARRHWGQGYATDALLAVLDVAAMLGHRRVVACHFLDNPASGRVLEKAGFIASGEIVERFSAGRGHCVSSARYVLDIANNGDGSENRSPMAA